MIVVSTALTILIFALGEELGLEKGKLMAELTSEGRDRRLKPPCPTAPVDGVVV